MELTMPSKKIMLATIFTSALTFAISQAAMAEPAKAAQGDTKEKSDQHSGQVQMGSEMQKVHEKFLTDTVAIRKELAEKNAVMRALLNAGTPDTVKASQIAGELFELREKLRARAKEAGLPLSMLMMGAGADGLPCQGMMGHGMTGRHHRMM